MIGGRPVPAPTSMALVIAALAVVVGCGAPKPAEYVGVGGCQGCHAAEVDAWTGSHHDLAMQPAADSTVLGDFADAEFDYFGRKTTFSRDGNRFVVQTEGPEGEDRVYEVAYTFGVTPLQQYLVPFERGRMQVLSVAWDSRPESDGGQRWFHLYPDEPVRAGDPLHWTGLLQNWNTMCAACHSTALKKNYDPATDAFSTQWREIDVACEACHGPGSRHVEWAARTDSAKWPSRGTLSAAELRLDVDVPGPAAEQWVVDPQTGSVRPLPRVVRDPRIDTCAPCHSRRAERVDGPPVGTPFDDAYRLALLDEGLYHADGQIDDEVYVYGSFLQSRMAAAGVVCADCHDSHSLRTRVPGNALCARCHLPDRFDRPEHHGHPAESTGARCVACHMPTKTYMVVDPRLDHSIRVPRPLLSARIGAPDACTGCHTDRSPEWAATAIRSWGYDEEKPHYGDVLFAGRQGSPGAASSLSALLADTSAASIVRATAAELLGRYPSRPVFEALRGALTDPSDRVRLAAVEALAFADSETRWAVLAPSLSDRSVTVRAAAGRLLTGSEPSAIPADAEHSLDAALAEWNAAERAVAERPEARQNLAILAQQRGAGEEAEAEYRAAIRLAPWFTPAYANLADLLRTNGDEPAAEQLLRDGIGLAADPALLRHSLGLLLVRSGRLPEAIEQFRIAAGLRPEIAEFSYVLAIAVHETGDSDEALAILREAHERSRFDPRLLQALATMSRDAGRTAEATEYAQQLVDVLGADSGAAALLEQLRSEPANR